MWCRRHHLFVCSAGLPLCCRCGRTDNGESEAGGGGGGGGLPMSAGYAILSLVGAAADGCTAHCQPASQSVSQSTEKWKTRQLFDSSNRSSFFSPSLPRHSLAWQLRRGRRRRRRRACCFHCCARDCSSENCFERNRERRRSCEMKGVSGVNCCDLLSPPPPPIVCCLTRQADQPKGGRLQCTSRRREREGEGE